MAAISEIASALAPHVTNSIIDSMAVALDVPVRASNKAEKLRILIGDLYSDGRRRGHIQNLVVDLLVEIHARTLQGKCVFQVEDVDAVGASLHRLGTRLDAGTIRDLKAGLSRRSNVVQTDANAPPQAAHSTSDRPPQAAASYPAVQKMLVELTRPGVTPQHRGRQLEILVLEVLKTEHLSPEHRVVIPGEEIDIAFSLGGHHYLLECKWERDPIGLAPLHNFSRKVETKAVGTFGAMLSMSGFVRDINEKAARGAQLSIVGMDAHDLMSVLEGRATWARIVETARRAASTRSLFFHRYSEK